MTDIYEKVATNIKELAPINPEFLARVDNAKALVKYLSSKNLQLDEWRKLIVKNSSLFLKFITFF